MTTRKGELSVRVEGLVVLQKSLRPLPDKWHGLQDLEQRSRHRYLDLMVNEEARQVAMTRVVIVSELRRQFEDRGFVEVDTPILLPQATGAMARPFRTEHHALGMTMYLRIATELYLKRLVVGGLERVFEIGRIFRNEGIDSTHNPEFTMLEAYQALADYRDILVLIEEVFGAVTESAIGGTSITYRGRGARSDPSLSPGDDDRAGLGDLGRVGRSRHAARGPEEDRHRGRGRDGRRLDGRPPHRRDLRGGRRGPDLGADVRHPPTDRGVAPWPGGTVTIPVSLIASSW